MFPTTDLIDPLAAARDRLVLQPGLPARRRASRTAEPEDPDGAARHPRLHHGRPDRAGRLPVEAVDTQEESRRRRGWCRGSAAQAGAHPRCRPAVTTTDHARAVSDPVGFITDLVVAIDDRLDARADPGRRLRSRRRSSEIATSGDLSRRSPGRAERRPVPGAPGGRRPAHRAARRPVRRFAAGLRRVRQTDCGPCNAGARTGTAGPAATARFPAPPAANIRRVSTRDRAGSPVARNAPTAMIAIRSPSSTTWSPSSIRPPTGDVIADAVRRSRPGPHINGSSPGRWKRNPNCSPVPGISHPCGRSSG